MSQDHRENLFNDYRELANKLKIVNDDIAEMSKKLDDRRREAQDLEAQSYQLRQAIEYVIVDEFDPVMARIKVHDDSDRRKEYVYRKSPGVLVNESYISVIDDSPPKLGRIKRMITACTEIWKNA